MTSITDVVKEGFKYPFNDGKKVLTLGIIFLISSLLSFAMEYFVFDSIRVMEQATPAETVHLAFASILSTNITLMSLTWIITFVLLLFAGGYSYNIIKYSIEGKYDLPDFKDIKELFINGIKCVIVSIVYSILPGILFILGLMLAVNEAVGSTVNSIGGIILLIAMIFAIFCALVEIMALCNMIAKDELAAAFRFKEILALIKNIGWGKYIGILLFIVIAVAILFVFLQFIFGAIAFGFSALIGSALLMVLINMILTSLLINPYITVVISRVYGSVYRQATNPQVESAEEAETIV